MSLEVLRFLGDSSFNVRQVGLGNALTLIGLIEFVEMALTFLLKIFDLLGQMNPILSHIGQPSRELEETQKGQTISQYKEVRKIKQETSLTSTQERKSTFVSLFPQVLFM